MRQGRLVQTLLLCTPYGACLLRPSALCKWALPRAVRITFNFHGEFLDIRSDPQKHTASLCTLSAKACVRHAAHFCCSKYSRSNNITADRSILLSVGSVIWSKLTMKRF